MQHGVAHACAFGHAQGGTACGHDPALDFELGKTTVVRGHDDVGGQHQLDAQGVGDALDGHHQGLLTPAKPLGAQVDWIDIAQGRCMLAALHQTREAGQVQTRREMLARRAQDAHAQVGRVVQQAVGLGQLGEHGRGETIALGRAVDGDLQHRALHQVVNAPFGGAQVFTSSASRSSKRPSAWRAKRPVSRECTGSEAPQGQPPNSVRR